MTASTTPAGATEQELRELKSQMSERILDNVAAALGMTVGEYGSVYDSERHEQLLNNILSLVTRYSEQHEASAVLDGKIEELTSLKQEIEYRLRNDLQVLGQVRTLEGLDGYMSVVHDERKAALTKQKAAMQQEEK